MKVFITGAAGFLGRAVVKACAAAGHDVMAMVRPASGASPLGDGGVRLVRGDLRQAGDWQDAVGEADAIIHLAAAVGGDLATQFAGTVTATENLLDAVPAGLKRFVHISSFSVYDFRKLGWGATLDEGSPLETRPEQRDAYTWTKLIQERLVTDACGERSIPLAVIRPGAIYGPGKDWDYGRALKVGPFDLIFSPFASMRLTQVDNCADAIVKALEAPSTAILNIVDAQAPGFAAYHRRCKRAGAPTGFAIYVPWIAVAALGRAVQGINRLFFGGRARLPEILDYPRQVARWKPLRYDNRRARAALRWDPVLSSAATPLVRKEVV